MALPVKSGLVRLLFFVIVVTTISYLALNVVSFACASWISYNNEQIYFGLWGLCNKNVTPNICYQWDEGKPDFIRAAEALEVVSFIFYTTAILFIIIGIITPDEDMSAIGIFIAAGLLFIPIVFISATLGIMSVKGRVSNTYYSINVSSAPILEWAWWVGLFGLIMTAICFASLIGFAFAIKHSSKSEHSHGNGIPTSFHSHPNSTYGTSHPIGGNNQINSSSSNNTPDQYIQNPASLLYHPNSHQVHWGHNHQKQLIQPVRQYTKQTSNTYL